MPCCVNYAKDTQIQNQGQACKPWHPLPETFTHLVKSSPVLLDAVIGMGAQRATLGPDCVEPEGVDLVVSKDRMGISIIDHSAHGLEHLPDLGPSVDVVA